MKKFLKFVFIAILFLVATVVICTFAFTENYKVLTLKRSVEVNAPKEKVFDYISHTENKANWIVNSDKKITRTSMGKDATVGFVRKWEVANPPEKGSETITKIEDGLSVETKIENNLKGEEYKSTHRLSCVPDNTGKTIVTWENTSEIPLNFAARMFLGFAELMAKSIDNQQAYDEGIESGLEKEGVYKEMDDNLQKLKNNIENY